MKDTENRPRVEFTTLVPLGVGVLSLFGICLLLVMSRVFATRSTVQVPDTATPFRYLFLGTEPGISSEVPTEEGTLADETAETDSSGLTPESTGTPRIGFAITAISGFSSSNTTEETPSESPTESPSDAQNSTNTSPVISSSKTPIPTFTLRPTSTSLQLTSLPSTRQPTNTLLVSNLTATRTTTPTRTATSAGAAPLNAGTYDDTDSHLIYSGNWTSQSVPGAYQNTLHVSTTLGNSITFRFIGQEVRIFYQSGPSLGKMRIIIDEREFELDQFDEATFTSEWVSASLPAGTHTVTIRHAEGGSVNLDQIIVPEITGTATPTPTSTP